MYIYEGEIVHTVNQETAAELLSFFQRTFPRPSKPAEKTQVPKRPQPVDNPNSSLQSNQVSCAVCLHVCVCNGTCNTG